MYTNSVTLSSLESQDHLDGLESSLPTDYFEMQNIFCATTSI